MRFPTSDPASGSDIAIDSTLPSAIAADDVLLLLIGAEAGYAPATIMLTEKKPIGISPRADSSSSRQRSTAPPPEPPYSCGIAAPSQPSSATCL